MKSSQNLPTAPCKLCGKPIVWGKDDKGARIPLDPRAPVYAVRLMQGGAVDAMRDPESMVSHFATCPKVGDLKRT